MDKEVMYWCDFCLFKVGFNQLINKLSFIYVELKKQSREQAFKQSVDDIKYWYICDVLSL